MARRFYGSIDVNRISKDKLVKGRKGLYAPIIVWLNDEPDQYGNTLAIQEDSTKEEREGGHKANYLGNLKEADGSTANVASDEDLDGLPF